MQSERFEYILKGVFLGLLLFVAANAPDFQATGRIALCMLAGLGAALLLALIRQFRDLGRLGSNPLGFFLFLLLENPFFVYAGLVFGLAAGAILEQSEEVERVAPYLLWYCVGGGAILGYGFGEMRRIKDGYYRFAIPAAVMVIVGYLLSDQIQHFVVPDTPEKRHMLAMHILLGLPFFYLLTFVGIAEESEVEIAAICGALGFAIYLLGFPKSIPSAGFLIPVALYFVYSVYWLPGLRVFKHTLRGYSFLHLGRIRASLLSFRRALELDPRNELAQEGLWRLHRNLDVEVLTKDPRLVEMLDPSQILTRAERLLARPPSPAQLTEANKLIDLAERHWPQLRAQIDYHRSVAALHARQTDRAVELTDRLLDPAAWPPDDTPRRSILFQGWQLALLGHPELRRRVGEPQLARPGRRMEAIVAVERRLARTPDDPGAAELRKQLYEGLREEEYVEAARQGPVEGFGYEYAEALGMGLIDDPGHWQRGALFLRIAGHGLPQRGPAIFEKLAHVSTQKGDRSAAERYLQKIKESGLIVGVANLAAEQKQIYFSTVKRLADESAARGDWDEAIADYSLYTQFEGSGLETLRSLAEMYEQKKDAFNALRVAEKALLYDSRDANLLERKDRYYYSLEPETLQTVVEDVKGYFDVKYCVRKAKELLDKRNTDLDVIDWALHLTKLALVMQPKNINALVQKARCHLRRGERDDALKVLEDVFHDHQPSGGEETDAWYFAAKQLGKLYLDELARPDLAIPCFQKYQESLSSGAETLYDLGRAYEAVGDKARAISYYRTVTGYEENPLRWDAQEAIRRLQGQA
jgi:tetratricopeptide (TPR) repeat protein